MVDRLLNPKRRHPRRYWAQVEGLPDEAALDQLGRGVEIRGQRTLPCRAWRLDPPPDVAPREPPIRVRKSVPDSWIALELLEGRNRQVRRMAAAVGYPVLRLLRVGIGALPLGDLPRGEWKRLSTEERDLLLAGPSSASDASTWGNV